VSGALGWLRARLGVRVVTSLAAALSVAVVLLLAGAALVLLTDRLLRSSLEETATEQAEVVAQRVAANFEDDVKKNAVDATAQRSDLVQVVRDYGEDGDHDIEVLGASNPLWSMKPMASALPEPGDTEVVGSVWVTHHDGIKQTDPETTDEFLVVAYGTSVKGRDLVVYAAQSLGDVHEAVETVFHLVLIGIPLLVLITGIVTYLAAGRALRPVEAIRARVATTRDPSVRVPVPPARDEVGRLAETMNEMLARLQAGQAVQRRFVADASHELRSPLATIATGLELLSRDSDRTAADRDTVTALRGETERLGRLVDALLLLARADESGLRPRFEDVDLDEVAEAERLRPAGRIVPRIEAAHVRVVGDRGQLAQVVRNLVDNACRHARSTVLVSVRRLDGYAALDVADDGPGVPPDQRARVFERFVRLDDARARSDGGAGLGLAIVAEVVAAHGGTVDVVDGPMGGALFRVRLPLPAEEDAVEEEVAEPADTPAEPDAPAEKDAPAHGGPAARPAPQPGRVPRVAPG
jgi:signal transduction histidine kinase